MAPFSKRLTTTLRRPPRDADQVDLELQAPQSRSEVFELKSPRVQPHSRRPPRKPEARSLLSLPPEIQLLVVRFLDFGEIEALRRTCHHFRSLLEHDAVIDLFGSVPRLHDAQLATCCVCLQRTEPAKRIWVDPASDRNWPLAGKCTSCAYAEGDLQIDKMVTLGDWSNCYICRWCGQPAIQPEGSYLLKTHEFHHKCWLRYKVAILFRRAMGAVSFLLTLIPAVLALVLLNQEWQLVVASVVSRTPRSLPLFQINLLVALSSAVHLRRRHTGFQAQRVCGHVPLRSTRQLHSLGPLDTGAGIPPYPPLREGRIGLGLCCASGSNIFQRVRAPTH